MHKLFIDKLTVPVLIGCAPQERTQKQVIEIDVEVSINIEQAAQSDDLNKTINYKDLVDRIKIWVEQTEFELIETLADFLAKKIQQTYSVQSLRLTITKHPIDMPEVKGVGISIEVSAAPAKAGAAS